MDENKHYIRVDLEGYILKAFSDAFESPTEGDICISENGGRHLIINGIVNPAILGMRNEPLKRYVDGQIIDSPKPIEPKPQLPTDIEALQTKVTTLEAELELTQQALDQLIMNGGIV